MWKLYLKDFHEFRECSGYIGDLTKESVACKIGSFGIRQAVSNSYSVVGLSRRFKIECFMYTMKQRIGLWGSLCDAVVVFP